MNPRDCKVVLHHITIPCIRLCPRLRTTNLMDLHQDGKSELEMNVRDATMLMWVLFWSSCMTIWTLLARVPLIVYSTQSSKTVMKNLLPTRWWGSFHLIALPLLPSSTTMNIAFPGSCECALERMTTKWLKRRWHRNPLPRLLRYTLCVGSR